MRLWVKHSDCNQTEADDWSSSSSYSSTVQYSTVQFSTW